MHSYAIAAVTADGADWGSARALRSVALTPVQRRIYDFIRDYQQLWGASPLYREIAHGCGLRSDSAVQYQISRLVRLGLMRKPPRLVRVIVLTAVPLTSSRP